MDENNNTAEVVDRNQLVGAVYLQPTRTAEFIVLDFNVLPTGATFYMQVVPEVWVLLVEVVEEDIKKQKYPIFIIE